MKYQIRLANDATKWWKFAFMFLGMLIVTGVKGETVGEIFGVIALLLFILLGLDGATLEPVKEGQPQRGKKSGK